MPQIFIISTWSRMDSANETSSDNKLWGWEEFFREIYKLLRDLDSHYALCTIDYASYAVQRLKLAVSSVAHLKIIWKRIELLFVHTTTISLIAISDMEELL